MKIDYVPRQDLEFDGWLKFIVLYTAEKCSGKPPEWDHIPQTALTALKDALAAWTAAYEQTLVPHTSPETKEKIRIRKTTESAIRGFVNRWLRFELVTNEDRDKMKIPNRNARPAPVPKPHEAPYIHVSTPLPRIFRFRFRGSDSIRWGKPARVHGIEVYWIIADAPPETLEGFPHCTFATKSPLDLSF
ncbi:MAG: hypothetical protein LBU18_03725 [Treponema sp.]|nr:hypothetical protein [Treponema sp.]